MDIVQSGNPIEATALEYQRRKPDWDRTRALLRGTSAMRSAGQAYLPKFRQETESDYQTRLNATVLHAGFASIVRTMSSLPFGEKVIYHEDIPEVIRGRMDTSKVGRGGWIEDIDLAGTHCSIFMARTFRLGIAHGSAHILVDKPPTEARNLAESRRERPKWLRIPPWSLLDARKEIVGGQLRYTYVKLDESIGEGNRIVRRIREIEPGEWRLFEAEPGRPWEMVASGAYDMPYVTMASFIPVADDDEDYTSHFTGPSPLENVAHLNVTHWQSSSDQRNALTFGRFAILALTGVSEASQFLIGPRTVLTLPEGATASLIEPTGAGIANGERDLKALEEAMEAEGIRLLIRRPGNVTATAVAADETKDQSDLEAMTRMFEDVAEQALAFTAEWAELPDGGSISLNRDFGIASNAAAAASTILRLRELGDLSPEDALQELKLLGLLSDKLNVGAVVVRARQAAMMDLAPLRSGSSGAGDENDDAVTDEGGGSADSE